MNNLIVGKNSVIVKNLLKNFTDLPLFFDVVSHSELFSLKLYYDKCYIFSYSLSEIDNQKIIDWCCANCNKVYYISSSSVIVAKHGELYSYPKIKMLAEEYGCANYKNFYIRRLGYVVSNEKKEYYISYTTEINDIHKILLSNDNVSVENIFNINPNLKKNKIKSKIIMGYSLFQYWIMPASILLRPIDLILKILGIRSYGYTSLGDRLWMSMKK